jgi:hypothetical protein
MISRLCRTREGSMRLATPLFAVLGALVSLAGPVAAGTAPGSRDYPARQKEGIRLLDGISRSLPESLWLDRLTVSPQQILIEGKALNTNAIANFIENLDRLPGFTEPTLRDASEEPGGIYSYSLSLETDWPPESAPRTFASPGELPDALRRLRALFERPGITTDRFVPAPLTGEGLPEQVTPVKILARAESYQPLLLLFDELARFSPVVALKQMAAVRKGDEGTLLTVDLVLEIPSTREAEAALPEAAASDSPPLPAPPRHPFQVLTLDEQTRLRRLRPEGVPGLLTGNLDLQGIFRTSRGYVAQVTDRETGKSYLLKGGDRLHDGAVVRVTRSELVLQHTPADAEAREVILKGSL